MGGTASHHYVHHQGDSRQEAHFPEPPLVLWGSHGALFPGSILGTRGAHMEPHPWDYLGSQGALPPR